MHRIKIIVVAMINKNKSPRSYTKKPKPVYMGCPCESNSCVINRRSRGKWSYEDDIFIRESIPLRKSCMDPYTPMQELALRTETDNVFWDNSKLWNSKL